MGCLVKVELIRMWLRNEERHLTLRKIVVTPRHRRVRRQHLNTTLENISIGDRAKPKVCAVFLGTQPNRVIYHSHQKEFHSKGKVYWSKTEPGLRYVKRPYLPLELVP